MEAILYPRLLYRAITFALIVASAFLLQGCNTASPKSLAVGDTAPPFTLPAAGDGKVSSSDFTGKKNLLLYFSMTSG